MADDTDPTFAEAIREIETLAELGVLHDTEGNNSDYCRQFVARRINRLPEVRSKDLSIIDSGLLIAMHNLRNLLEAYNYDVKLLSIMIDRETEKTNGHWDTIDQAEMSRPPQNEANQQRSNTRTPMVLPIVSLSRGRHVYRTATETASSPEIFLDTHQPPWIFYRLLDAEGLVRSTQPLGIYIFSRVVHVGAKVAFVPDWRKGLPILYVEAVSADKLAAFLDELRRYTDLPQT